MKAVLVFLLLINTTNLTFAEEKGYESYYVISLAGLNMRSEPSINSKIVQKIQYQKEVAFIERTNNEWFIENTTSKWVKISVDDRTGYVLEIYLSKNKAPKKSDVSINYIDQLYKLTKDKKCIVYNSVYLGISNNKLIDIIGQPMRKSSFEGAYVVVYKDCSFYYFIGDPEEIIQGYFFQIEDKSISISDLTYYLGNKADETYDPESERWIVEYEIHKTIVYFYFIDINDCVVQIEIRDAK
jgi:uncharacterized protein YgiM (DUF1202 family)